MPKSESLKYFKIVSVIIFIVAVGLRLGNIANSLQYDEIWTLGFYVDKPLSVIFTDLATPNNHPLNTLIIKWTFDPNNVAISIRLGALIAGILSVPAMGYLALLLLKRRQAALIAMATVALSPQLIVYSQLARGYSLQLFMLLIYGIGATLIWQRRNMLWGIIANAIGGIGAILTLSTSVLFLAPVGLILAVKSIQQKRYKDLALLAIPGYFAIYWYWVSYGELQKGQHFSASVDTIGSFVKWFVPTFNQGAGVPIDIFLILAILAYKFNPKTLYLLLFGFFAFAVAPLVGAGPPRVYFPLVIVVALLLGSAASLRWIRRYRVTPMVILLLLLAWSWQGSFALKVPDYHALFREVQKEPLSRLVLNTATENLPYEWNNGTEVQKDRWNRVTYPNLTELLMLNSHQAINGLDAQNAERSFELPFAGTPYKVGDTSGELYKLERLNSVPLEGEVLLIIVNSSAIDLFRSKLEQGNYLILSNVDYLVIALKVAKSANINWRDILDEPASRLKLYRIADSI